MEVSEPVRKLLEAVGGSLVGLRAKDLFRRSHQIVGTTFWSLEEVGILTG
jgi:hypothetical protein